MLDQIKITIEEITELFGERIPYEALVLIATSPSSATCDEVRVQLHELADRYREKDIPEPILIKVAKILARRAIERQRVKEASTGWGSRGVTLMNSAIEALWPSYVNDAREALEAAGYSAILSELAFGTDKDILHKLDRLYSDLSFAFEVNDGGLCARNVGRIQDILINIRNKIDEAKA